MSVLFVFITSILFYKNFFYDGFSEATTKVDISILKTYDLKLNMELSNLSSQINYDETTLDSNIKRIKEILNLIVYINKSTKEISFSISSIEKYFNKKIIEINKVRKSHLVLKNQFQELYPALFALREKKIYYYLEGQSERIILNKGKKVSISIKDRFDFYQQAYTDLLNYLVNPTQLNLGNVIENKKIFNHIGDKNELITNYQNKIENILNAFVAINETTNFYLKDDSIDADMALIDNYFSIQAELKERDNKIFLFSVMMLIISVISFSAFYRRRL